MQSYSLGKTARGGGGLTLLLSVTPSTGWGPQNRSYVQESFSGEFTVVVCSSKGT